jgi:DmsE family decaheme c-type cytochrome
MRRTPLIVAAAVAGAVASIVFARAPVAQTAPTYAGSEACKDCHADQYASWERTSHGRAASGAQVTAVKPGCESCHGPGSAHIAAAGDTKDPGFATIHRLDKMTPEAAAAVCQQCHTTGDQFYWATSTHANRGLTCIQCHSVHAPKDPGGASLLKAERASDLCMKCHLAKKFSAQKSAHMPVREGGMECTACHTPHGSAGPKQLRAATVNEVCESCHADKRGPFLWEHAPVRENCVTCHEPHGTNGDKLLASRKPFLCQRCHIATRHPSSLYDTPDLGAGSNRITNRSCTNCHSQIHGSNHPSGNTFLR